MRGQAAGYLPCLDDFAVVGHFMRQKASARIWQKRAHFADVMKRARQVRHDIVLAIDKKAHFVVLNGAA